MQSSRRIKHNAGPRVFVAMPFGEKKLKRSAVVEGGRQPAKAPKEVSVDFDEIWRRLIRPALEQAGCRPYRADEEASAGDIRTDMFFELVTGEFVLADISTLNANVFYELGVRHGVSPRGVLMVDGGWDRRPFDVAPDRTFTYTGRLFEKGPKRDLKKWQGVVRQEVRKLAGQLQAAIATDASTTSSPVYKELMGLKAVEWGGIQNAKARYFGGQLQEFNARVRKAKRQSHVGDILTLSRDGANRFIEWTLRLDAARALSDLGRNERARELLRAMVNEDPTCPKARYALARTLDRLAREKRASDKESREYHGRAEMEIEEALRRGGNDPEADRILGGIYKYRWRHCWEDQEVPEERVKLAKKHWETAKKALFHYREAQMHDLGFFHAGLNIISLSRLRTHLGVQDSAQAEADLDDMVGLVKTAARRAIERALQDSAKRDQSNIIWAIAASAEVALLTGRLNEAQELFQRAATHPDVSVSHLTAFDEQLEMYDKLAFETDCVAQLREFVREQRDTKNTWVTGRQTDAGAKGPKVLAFRGESFDDPELGKDVAATIRALLIQWEVGKGDVVICSARRGSEIVFAEECVRREADVRLLLPLARAEFVSESVRLPGSDWEERFNDLAKKCEVLEQPLRLGPAPAELDAYDRNDFWCLDLARTEFGRGEQPRVAVLSMSGDDPGSKNEHGTLGHFEQCAHDLGLLVERIAVSETEELTWFPRSDTLAHVRRPNGQTDTVPLVEELRVGRAGENDLIIDDRRISRHHLRLTPVAGGVHLINLSGHPNATFLDGVALIPDSAKKPVLVTLEQTVRLVDGTEITFEKLQGPG